MKRKRNTEKQKKDNKNELQKKDKDGEQIKTSTLKHLIEEVESETCVVVEPIEQGVFELTNQYWVSFRLNDITYDRKYIFVKGSIDKSNFTNIPILNEKGVLIM